LHLDLSANLPAVMGNATQIRQLVMNFVINASQAIGEGDGAIHVKTSLVKGNSFSVSNSYRDSMDEYVRLAVSDTGCGMTEEEKARIFDPFFTTKPRGHGLGLAVVQGIVHSHNGVINVSSTVGEGSTFEVLFRTDGAYTEIAPTINFDAKASTRTPVLRTVLLVEDEDQLRIATATALEKRGFSVVSAADGQKAVELFRAQAEDIGVVILDLSLPGLPGHEVFREIRAVNPKVKVVFTSAYDARIGDALSDRYASSFLQKPYRFADLFAELNLALLEPPQVSVGISRPA
jgi:CheY-like chemotaxis protein